MSTGLRERKQRAAMQAIQEAALDLFDERGYGAVSVEEIADRAEVSPSSVYRYFGTKAGIIVTDDDDPWLRRDVGALLSHAALTQPWDLFVSGYAAEVGAKGLALEDAGRTMRRLRYFFGEPEVRLALYEVMDAQATIISEALAATGRLTPTQAHVLGHAFEFGFWAAVEEWHAAGATRPLLEYVEEGLGILAINLPGDQIPPSTPHPTRPV